jgi:hypothetical protein
MGAPEQESDDQHVEDINTIADECADEETPAAAISIQIYDELNNIGDGT